MIQSKFEGAFRCFGNCFGQVFLQGNCVNQNGKFFRIRYCRFAFANSQRCNQRDCFGLFLQCDLQFVTNDGCGSVGCFSLEIPSNSNVGIRFACRGKSVGCVFRKVCRQREVFFFVSHLFGGSTFGQADVFECVGSYRCEVESAVIHANNARYVCNPTGVFGVACFERCLFFLGEGANRGGNTNVGFHSVKFETVVAAACVLAGNFYAFDGNKLRLRSVKSRIFKVAALFLCRCRFVKRGNVICCGHGAVCCNNFDGSIFYFVRAAVEVFCSSCKNCVANFNAQRYGVVGHAVNVVAAVFVVEVQAVGGVTFRFGNNTGNYALHCNGFACCG